MQTGDWIALLSVVVSAVGLAFAGYGIHRGNTNASVESHLAFNEAIRAAWERFFFADIDQKDHHFAELANLLEIGCAIQIERTFVGVSRELLTEYLDAVLTLLSRTENARNKLSELVENDKTFKYIRRYLRATSRPGDPI